MGLNKQKREYMKNQIITLNPEEFGIEKKQANELIGNLPEIIKERSVLEKQYSKVAKMDIEDPETSTVARELRLLLQKNRTQGINVWHKTTKDYFLKGGQFVDAIKRKEVAVNERMENELEEIEKYTEIQEKKRLDALQLERAEILLKYVDDAHERRLNEMDDDVWDAYLSTRKKQYEDNILAEKKAEEERLENERIIKQRDERNNILLNIQGVKRNPNMTYTLENLDFPDASHLIDIKDILDCEEKQFNAYLSEFKSTEKSNIDYIEKQRKENDRLKKEAEAKEKALELERKKAREEADKKEAERQAEIKAEREKQARLEAKIKAHKDAEEKAKIEEQKRLDAEKKEAEKLAKAPIKKQLHKWVSDMTAGNPPVLNNTSKDIIDKFESFKAWALKQIDSL